MTKHLFVINPKSFLHMENKTDIYVQIADCFQSDQTDYYKIVETRFPREAIALTRNYVENVRPGTTVRVYAIGGDGILFDCLNGLVGLPNVELASIPYGNINDFIRSFGEGHTDIFRDIALAVISPAILTDVISCGGNYGLINALVGIEAKSVLKTNSVSTWLGKNKNLSQLIPYLYILSALIVTISPKNRYQPYEINADGEDLSGQYGAISFGNGPGYSGNKVPFIEALPNDGVLEMLMAKGMGYLKMISKFKAYLYGKSKNHPDDIMYRQIKKVNIKSSKPLAVGIDGEFFYDTELDIEIIPNCIRMVVPDGMDYKRPSLL